MLAPNLLFLLDSPNLAQGYALAGTPARVLALAEHSRRSGAHVTLALCDRGGDYGTAADWPVDVVLVHPADYYDPNALARIISGAEVDLISVCEAQALIALGRPLADQLQARLIYDVHDDDSSLARSLHEPPAAVAGAARTQRAAFDVSDAVIACAQRELMLALGSDITAERAASVPNGVDIHTAHWAPSYGAQRLVFIGNLFYLPNQLAVEHIRDRILPGLRERCPQVRIHVIGRGPEWLTQSCGRMEFLGPAPSIEAALRDATIGLAPLTAGAGSKMKVLNYMAAGLPVLATSEAASGLPPGHPGVVVDDELDRWADRIATLLGDPAMVHRIGRAGRHTVEQQLSWQKIASGFVHCCRHWMKLPERPVPSIDPRPLDVARWLTEHAAQGAVGEPRHTSPGKPVHLRTRMARSVHR